MLNCIWGQHPTCPITHLNDVGHPEVDSALCRVPSASWLGSGSLERAQPTTAWGPPFLGSSRAGCGFRPQNSTSAPSMVASPGVPPLLQLLLASGVCPAQGWACWKLSRRLLGGSVASLCSSSLRGVPEMALPLSSARLGTMLWLARRGRVLAFTRVCGGCSGLGL